MARTIAKDHDQKRRQILAAAAHVFAPEGFDRASMARLADECGISKANIYHYYDSKDALLYDLLRSYLLSVRDRILNLDVAGLDPDARLRHVLRAFLMAYQGADDQHRVQIGGLAFLPDDQQEELRGYQRELVKYVGAVLSDCAPEVFAQSPDKLRAATMSVFGMLNWYFMWSPDAGPEAREDYAALVADMTLKGLPGI